jgi:hypothetical protein
MVTVGALPNDPVAVTDVYVSAVELAEDDALELGEDDDAPELEEEAPQPASTATASREIVASAAARRRRMETFRV